MTTYYGRDGSALPPEESKRFDLHFSALDG
jgi:hypothetical protein